MDSPVTSTCVHTPTRRDSGTSVLENPLDFAVLSPQQGLPPSSSSLPAATAASQRIREEVRMLGRNLDSASFMAHVGVCCMLLTTGPDTVQGLQTVYCEKLEGSPHKGMLAREIIYPEVDI